MYDQVSKYFEIRFSKLQSGFRKGYSAKHCLLAIIEKRKTAFDNGGVFAALLTDLSKVCDCIPHDLIIDKLVAYDFDTNALKLIHNIYLTGSKEWRLIVLTAYGKMFYGVPRGSILEPLLFNINLCDLFYFLENTDTASYANKNSLFSWEKYYTIETSSQVLLIGLIKILCKLLVAKAIY